MGGGEPVTVEVEGRIATVALARPQRRNAMDGATLAALDAALAGLAAGAEAAGLAAVVLRGAGGFFCAGWDRQDLARLAVAGDADLAAAFAANHATLDRLAALPCATIAWIEGGALGFGLSLAARCDLAVALDDARFGAPELSYGIAPASILGDLAAVLGRRRASQWLLDCAIRGAREALADGLLTAVVPASDADAALQRLLAPLRAAPPAAVRATVSMLRAAGSLDPAVAREQAIAGAIASLRAPEVAQALAGTLRPGSVSQ
jgi:enoyl-CoA hydratase/carnithine racemase